MCAERREVNKALTGENSVFTRRGRNSERATPANGAANSLNESRATRAPAVYALPDADAQLESKTCAQHSASSSSSSSASENMACHQLNGVASELDARRPSSLISPEGEFARQAHFLYSR